MSEKTDDIQLIDLDEDATNYSVVGDKKMGKTTLLRMLIKYLKRHNQAIIAYDRLHQFDADLPHYERITDVPANAIAQFSINKESVETFVKYVEVWRQELWKNKAHKLFVIVDELDTIYGQWGPLTDDPMVKQLLTDWIDYSRHLGLSLWGGVRRPQKIWQHYFEQSERIFCFHVTGDLALKKLYSAVASKNFVRAIANLPPHEYIVYPDEVSKFETTNGRQLNWLGKDDT